MELSVARKRLARLVLLRLVLLLLRRFGVDGLLVPLGRGLQLGRVALRSLVPYALDELAARVNGAGVYATESQRKGEREVKTLVLREMCGGVRNWILVSFPSLY